MWVRYGVVVLMTALLGSPLGCARGRAEPIDTPATTRPTPPPSALPAARDTPPASASPEPDSVPQGAKPQTPQEAWKLRKQELRRVVDESVGHMHQTRGMNQQTIDALQSAVRDTDQHLLTELLLDEDRVVARTAAVVLSTFGQSGLSLLQRTRDGLSGDQSAELRLLLEEYIAQAKRAAPSAAGKADPFEQPPRGTSPNCGPEHRQHFDVSLTSAQDFAEFLRDRGRWLEMPADFNEFRDAHGAVDWARVAASTSVSKLGGRSLFSIKLVPRPCAFYDLRMTSDGFTSLYGCCGV
jgi:hypothetical protein